ncbi:MAG: B12-binding domain-containing protein [Planctomycetota bacterium]
MHAPDLVAELLRHSARAHARAAVAELHERRPDLGDALPATFAAPRGDLEVRVLQLAEAVAVAAPELFVDAVGWYRLAFAGRGVPDDYLAESLASLQVVLHRELPGGAPALVEQALAGGLAVARRAPVVPPSPIERPGPLAAVAQRFLLAALEGRSDRALDQIEAALADGVGIAELQDEVLLPAQHEVGRMWLLGEAPIADEHLASQTVGEALVLLQRRVPRPPAGAPRVLAFGVSGNLHDLGIRMIAQRLQVAGFDVTSLGANLPASDLPFAFVDRHYDLMAVSATMLLHLGAARAVVAMRDRELGGAPPILLGGAPFAAVPDLHVRLGADASAATAAEAVRQAQRLVPRS